MPPGSPTSAPASDPMRGSAAARPWAAGPALTSPPAPAGIPDEVLPPGHAGGHVFRHPGGLPWPVQPAPTGRRVGPSPVLPPAPPSAGPDLPWLPPRGATSPAFLFRPSPGHVPTLPGPGAPTPAPGTPQPGPLTPFR
jgi:hypothetical protein